MAQGLLVIDVAELAATGADLDQLVAHAESLVAKVGVVAMLDTLEHLIKGGRVGGARALLGQVLSIKPLLELKDGVVAEAGRQRTRSKALVAIAEVVKSHAPLKRLALVHGASSEVAALEALVADIDTQNAIIVTDMGPVVGAHGGRGSLDCVGLRSRRPTQVSCSRERSEETQRRRLCRQGALSVRPRPGRRPRPGASPDPAGRSSARLRTHHPLRRAVPYWALLIGLIRFIDIYCFAGREYLSYVSVGAISLVAGLIIWRKRRPVNLRK